MKRQWLAIGIILLFVGTSVLSSIPARVTDVSNDENNSNNLITSTFTFVGFIKDKNVTIHQPEGDMYNASFTCILVFCFIHLSDESTDFLIMHYPEAFRIGGRSNFIGIFNEHFICAKFFWLIES